MRFLERFSQSWAGTKEILSYLQWSLKKSMLSVLFKGKGMESGSQFCHMVGEKWDWSDYFLERFQSETNSLVIPVNAQSHANVREEVKGVLLTDSLTLLWNYGDKGEDWYKRTKKSWWKHCCFMLGKVFFWAFIFEFSLGLTFKTLL